MCCGCPRTPPSLSSAVCHSDDDRLLYRTGNDSDNGTGNAVTETSASILHLCEELIPCACARALPKVVELGDDTRRAACAESPWPMIVVVTRDDHSSYRSDMTTTAAAVAAATTGAAAWQVTTWSSGSPAAVCKMRSSATVTTTVTTVAVRLTAVLLLLMASARPAIALGQLQGQYNGPYPDICPR